MATHRRLVKKEGREFYVTPAWGTRALLRYEGFYGRILEPCCGNGAMSKVLEKKNKVISSDIHRHGYGGQRDFFKIIEPVDNVVTNPPFNIAEEVLEHALKLARYKVALLLRTAFVESVGRFNRIFNLTPPTKLLCFSKRLSIYKASSKRTGGGTTSYSWFIWDKEAKQGKTELVWIDPGIE